LRLVQKKHNGEGEHRIEAELGESGFYEVKKPEPQVVENSNTTENEVLEPVEEETVEEPEHDEVVLKKEEKEVVDNAFNNLEFETGKSIIKESSYPSLLQLVKLLDANNSYKLYLVGHTDNVGDAMSRF